MDQEMDISRGKQTPEAGVEERRDRVVAALGEAFSQGQLSQADYESRVVRAENAVTINELTSAISDLAHQPSRKVAVPDEDSKDVFVLMSSRSLKGDWPVPRSVSPFVVMGDCHIDFSRVDIPEGGVHINATAIMGSIKISVPQRFAVQSNVSPIMGSYHEDEVLSTRRGEERPVIRISGAAIMGDIRVIHKE